MGEIGGHLTIRSIHIKVGVGLVLPKKDRKNIEKSVKKGKGGKTGKKKREKKSEKK